MDVRALFRTWRRAVALGGIFACSACGARRIDAVTGDPILSARVAHWSFDDQGGFVAHDDLDQDHYGVITGGEWIPDGHWGGALRLRRGDWVKVESFASPEADFSVSIWTRLSPQDVGASAWGTLLSTEKWTAAGPTFPSDGGWELHVGTFGESRSHFAFTGIVAPTLDGARRTRCCELEVDRWYHLVGVFDASSGKIRLYEGGLLQDESEVSGPVRPGDSTLYMGRSYVDDRARGAERMFSGAIDEVTLFNRALTESEVARLETLALVLGR